MECQNCRYLATPNEIVEGACPNCQRPYRDQPNPLNSDMEMRNMVAPGENDMGGNPLKEGILGDSGWSHPKVRDESFASVLATNHLENQYKQLLERAQSYPDIPVEELANEADPQVVQLVKKQLETGGNANLDPLFPDPAENVQGFEVKDMHTQQDHFRQPAQGHQLGWEPGTSGRGLFVGDDLHTWPVNKTPDNPAGGLMHSDYLAEHGLDPQHAKTGFEIEPDGQVTLLGNRDPGLADRIQAADPRLNNGGFGGFSLSRHAPLFHAAGPDDPYITSEFQPDDDSLDFQTTDVIPPGPHSVEATPQPGAGRAPYRDEMGKPSHDPSHTPIPGIIHNGSAGPLFDLGVKINGESADGRWNGHEGTVTLSHDDPEVLAHAKEIIESGGIRDMNRHRQLTHAHEGEVPWSPEVGMAIGQFGQQTGGAYVNHDDQYSRYDMPLHEKYGETPGAPMKYRSNDPEFNRLLDVLAQGDKQPMIDYLNRRQGSVHQAGGVLDAIGDAASDVGGVAGDIGGAALDAGQAVGLVPENLSLGELAGTAAWLVPGGLALKGGQLLARTALGAKAMAAAGGAGEAAGTAAAGTSLLGKAKNVAGNYLRFKGAEGLTNQALGVPPGGGYPAPPQPVQPIQNFTHLEVLALRDWHPSSDPVMHSDFPHQHADGDSEKPYADDINGIGGSQEPGKEEESSGDPEFDKHFPKLLIYAIAPESAEQDEDPEFVNFARQLASQDDGQGEGLLNEIFHEFENHLDALSADGDSQTIDGHGTGGYSAPEKHSNVPNLPTTGVNPGHVPVPPAPPGAPQAPSGVPGVNKCQCGHPLSPEATSCPACGAGTGTQPQGAVPGVAQIQPYGKTAASHMGPHNNEQFAAVAELLTEQGREQEIPDMLAQPWNYAEEMAQVQNKLVNPPIDDTLTDTPPEQPQEAAPPAATMPMPNMQQPQPALAHQAGTPGAWCPNCGGDGSAWNPQTGVAERCPVCHGAKVLDMPLQDYHNQVWDHPDQGVSYLKENHPGVNRYDLGGFNTADEYRNFRADPNNWNRQGSTVEAKMMDALNKHATPDSYAPRCPKCHSGTTGFVSEEGDCMCHSCGNKFKKEIVKDFSSSFKYVADHPTSLSWKDVTGAPLHVGDEYELRIPDVAIPDFVTISQVKPDAIEYKITGEYGVEHAAQINRDEMESRQYEFSPVAHQDRGEASDGEPNTMDSRQYVAPGETTDLSTPHMHTGAMGPVPGENEGAYQHLTQQPEQPQDEWTQIMDQVKQGVYGDWAKLRELAVAKIEEYQGPDSGHGISSSDINHTIMGLIKSGELQPGADIDALLAEYQPQGDWVDPYNEEPQVHSSVPNRPHLAYLLEGGGMETVADRKTAGAKFNQNEQRKFIDEKGEARNKDKLNLAGTHYEEDVHAINVNLLADSFL